MTAREVSREVDYDQDKPPDMRDVWMRRVSAVNRIEHFAQGEHYWLRTSVERAASDGMIDGRGNHALSSRDRAEVEALVEGRVHAVKVTV